MKQRILIFFSVILLLMFCVLPTYAKTRCPDLIIQSFTMALTNPTTADSVNFRVTIKNTGKQVTPASSLVVRMRGSDFTRIFSIDPLAPGRSYTVNYYHGNHGVT